MGKLVRCMAALVVVIGCSDWARGETLRGSVVAENGSPANGAHVWAAKLWINSLERVEVTADDQGHFAIDLGPGRWSVAANLGEQGLASMEDVGVEDGRELKAVTLRLSTQGRLRARLVEAETEKPIAGGRLVIDDGLDPIADRDGRFEVAGLSRTHYHEAFVVAPGRERKRVLFEMLEKPVTELEIHVPRGGKVIGRVLDLEGKPIAGAFVGKSTSGSILSLTGLWVRADAQGRFEFDGLVLDRTTWLNADAEGYELGQRSGVRLDAGSGPLEIEFRLAINPAAQRPGPGVAGGASTKATPPPFRLANRREVSGVVLDPDQRPVPRAAVRWDPDWSRETIEVKTDAEGRFRLAPVPDEPNIVSVIPEKSAFAPEFPKVEGTGDQDIRVTLAKGHSAKGVVCDDRGTPFAGVTVLPSLVGVGQNALALWERSTKTDAQGRFEVSGLPASGVLFTFLGDGVSDLRDHVLAIDKESIVTMSAAGAIRGRVVDHDGKPLRNFRVLLNASRERKPDDKFGGFFAGFCGTGLTCTSDDGSFLIRNLGAETVQRVTVLAAGHGERSIDRVNAKPLTHLSPERGLIFQLTRPFALRVQAVEEVSGKPIVDARVSLIYDDPSIDKSFSWGYHDSTWGDSVHARTDREGVAPFSPLSFGEGTILVRADGYARRHLGWRDGADKLTVGLWPEASVSGELIDATTGKPLEAAHISVHSTSGDQITALVQAGDAGRFRIGELPEGTYGFSITTSSGANLHDEQLTLQPGQHVSRTLRLSAAGAAVGRFIRGLLAPRPAIPEKLLKVGDTAPEFSVETLDDKPLSLKDCRGKYVLLDFWATWCGPCVEEMPHLRAVHEAFGKDPKFVMISLSLDASKDDVRKFLRCKDQSWTQVCLGNQSTEPVTKSYGIDLIPSILLLDPDGKIVAQDLRGTGIKNAVASVLKRD